MPIGKKEREQLHGDENKKYMGPAALAPASVNEKQKCILPAAVATASENIKKIGISNSCSVAVLIGAVQYHPGLQ